MATPPTFVASYPMAFSWYSSTTPKTGSVTVDVGDVLVVFGFGASNTNPLSAPTGGGLTYTLQQTLVVSGYTSTYIWTAPSSSSQTFTLSVARSSGSGVFGYMALRFSATTGVGASSVTNAATGDPTLGLTTTADNSALVVVNGDNLGTDGTVRTYLSVNGAAPTERSYQDSASSYTTYCATYADAGAAGSKTVGMTAPTGQKWAIAALEILGVPSTATSLVSPSRPPMGALLQL